MCAEAGHARSHSLGDPRGTKSVDRPWFLARRAAWHRAPCPCPPIVLYQPSAGAGAGRASYPSGLKLSADYCFQWLNQRLVATPTSGVASNANANRIERRSPRRTLWPIGGARGRGCRRTVAPRQPYGVTPPGVAMPLAKRALAVLDEGSVLELPQGLLQFGLAVHYNRAVPSDRLLQWLAGNEQKTHAFVAGLDNDLIAAVKLDEGAIARALAPHDLGAIDLLFGQHAKGLRSPAKRARALEHVSEGMPLGLNG